MTVQATLDALKSELSKDAFNDDLFVARLTSLKITARNPKDAPEVYCKSGLSVLADTAFGKQSGYRPKSQLEAARVIANALLLQDSLQQPFGELGYIDGLVQFYRRDDSDYAFVGARILFLLTYKSQVDFSKLIKEQNLIDHINIQLRRCAAALSDGSLQEVSMKQLALIETLKLLYNLAATHPEEIMVMSSALGTLIDLTSRVDMPLRPLDPPITQLLNVLAILDWSTENVAMISDSDLLSLCKQLISIWDQSTLTMQPAVLETMLIPLLTVLRNVYQVDKCQVNKELQRSLLPRDEERTQPLGRADTLAARLLRLQTSTGLTILPEAISSLLFDLSGRDAKKFIHNIGYGHAAGYLMTHQIPVPQDLETVSTHRQNGEESQINPITGQRLDAEEEVPVPLMTEAEKEREAEKMFVLFERLKAGGVVDIENPLRVAQQSGRLEELSDSEPD